MLLVWENLQADTEQLDPVSPQSKISSLKFADFELTAFFLVLIAD